MLKSISSDFTVPPVFFRNGHIQTLCGYFFRLNTPQLIGGKAIQIALPDGDILECELFERNSNLVVSLFHGFTGSIQSSYMTRVARKLLDQDCSVILVNHRGCGSSTNSHPKFPYHSGRGDDVSEVIKWCKQKFKNSKHLSIGFSLGASAVLSLLTGRRGNCLPDGAISVCAPLDVEKCSLLLSKGFNKLYQYDFLRSCFADLKKNPHTLQFSKLSSRIKTIYDFDDQITAPRCGLKGADEFYKMCSSGPFLKNIKTPTVLIAAKDDPMISFECYQNAQLSTSIKTIFTDYGGHLGFVTRGGVASRVRDNFRNFDDSWIESTISQLVSNFKQYGYQFTFK